MSCGIGTKFWRGFFFLRKLKFEKCFFFSQLFVGYSILLGASGQWRVRWRHKSVAFGDWSFVESAHRSRRLEKQFPIMILVYNIKCYIFFFQSMSLDF